MYESVEYVDSRGRNRYGKWFRKLNPVAAARVTRAVRNLEIGNFNNAKGIGGGVYECSIDTGPGYRVYYGRKADEIILLLAGGTKRGQQKDIDQAKADWAEFKNG